MSEPRKPVEATIVKCEVCLKEVPKSAARSAESEEYVVHFCGLECYDKWRKQEPESPRKDK